MIAAILRAQLLSMRPVVGARRAGAIFSAFTGLLFYGFWTFLAFMVLAFFSNPDDAPYFEAVLSTGLFFAMLYWQLAPVISAGFGASLDLRKLQVYPVPHGKLFAVEVLLRLTNGAEMLIILAGVTAGLMRNPLNSAGSKTLVLAGAVLFAATNILLSAGMRLWIEQLFARKHLRETAWLLFVLVLLAPRLLFYFKVGKATLLRLAPSRIVWPWGAVSHIMLHANAAIAALLSLAYLALAFWFGRRQFERSFSRDGSSAARKPEPGARTTGIREIVYRLPSQFLADPMGALVEKELRTLFRIPRFRMAYVMSAVIGILIWLPVLRTSGGVRSRPAEYALPVMAVYGLLMLGPISYWNAFGFDRGAVQGYFSWPIPFRDALIAKNITIALLLVPEVVMIALVAAAFRFPVTPGKCVETVAVVLIAALYWFALGNISSVRIPRAMDPDRMNQMANKLQALTIWITPFLLLPIVLAYWARHVFHSQIVFAGLLLIAGIVGGIFYHVALDSAVSAASQKRESMLTELTRSDGPLSIT